MRAFALLSLIPLAACVGTDRHEGFTATTQYSFLYSAHTSTLMTANDDGEAERIRQAWLVDALKAHAMCADGYVIDTRRLVPEPATLHGPQFGNGGDILYSGRCSGFSPPAVAPIPAVAPVPIVPAKPVRG
jgi:hypothetical protein